MTEFDKDISALEPEWPLLAWSWPLLRKGIKLTLDALAAWAALSLAALALGQGQPGPRLAIGFVLLALGVILGLRCHHQHYRLIGLNDVRTLLVADLGLALLATLAAPLAWGRPWPEGAALAMGASLLAGPLWLGLRLLVQGLDQWRQGRRGAEAGPWQRTLIVGAGRAGTRLCQELREDPRLRCRVVGFVDDALDKQGVAIQGVPVLGPTELLPVYIKEQRITQVILGMAGVPGARLRELTQTALAAGVQVRTVPGLHDLVGDHPWRPEVRDVAIEDLLRREPVLLDSEALRAAVAGATVLITGAGGSIGGELARRMAALRPGRLVLLGRGENSLWEIQRELARLFPEQVLETALCDIRNRTRLRQVFQGCRPDLVLHAAAHKHVPFLEAFPEEAVENNIFGTRNVAEAARDAGARILVNVSTDKAVNPVNILGVSKRIAEQVVARAAEDGGMRCVSVRFGNVLGSRGSVIPLFREQLRRGGPLTVTHPDMVRYFMTIPEAASLVLQAGLLGDSGKVFVLDMGEPVRIADLAREMTRLSGFAPGVDIAIRYTGVRPGEKLFEELFSAAEVRQTQVHGKIFEAVPDARERAELERGLLALRQALALPEGERQRAMLRAFLALVPSYQPSPSGFGRWQGGSEAQPVPLPELCATA
jgi:FlaA1/EpsC-like NDP-sugar epimerase